MFMKRLFSIAAFAAMAMVGMMPAQAQVTSGSGAGENGGTGFNCGAGMTYQVVNGMARCTSASPTGPVAQASCAAKAYTSGACAFDIQAATSGSTTVTSTKTSGYTGAVTATCNAGSWVVNSSTCAANPCPAATVTSGACSYTLPATASGSSTSASNSTAGYTGSATASCNAGAWTLTGSSCNKVLADCASATLKWGTACQATVSASKSGGSLTLTNTVAGYTGSAGYACYDGSWQGPTAASCNAVPTPTCPSPAPATTQTLACDPGYVGAITETRTTTCNAGTGWNWQTTSWSVTSNTCSLATATLYSCPATITAGGPDRWDHTIAVLSLKDANPSGKTPDGHAYCLYEANVGGDRMAGVFDRVVGKAVDYYPLFKDVKNASKGWGITQLQNWRNSAAANSAADPNYSIHMENSGALPYGSSDSELVFQGYEPVYAGSDNKIQGAYCSNRWSSSAREYGFYPGTCYKDGSGNFKPMCLIDTAPDTMLGTMARQNGVTRVHAGGDVSPMYWRNWFQPAWTSRLGSQMIHWTLTTRMQQTDTWSTGYVWFQNIRCGQDPVSASDYVSKNKAAAGAMSYSVGAAQDVDGLSSNVGQGNPFGTWKGSFYPNGTVGDIYSPVP